MKCYDGARLCSGPLQHRYLVIVQAPFRTVRNGITKEIEETIKACLRD
jgi:hypothetical protein